MSRHSRAAISWIGAKPIKFCPDDPSSYVLAKDSPTSLTPARVYPDSMENPLRPQPLMAEVLPGFTIILILAYAYCAAHPGTFTAVLASRNTATVIGGGVFMLFTSWIIGTFLDSLRDLLENLLDCWWFPVRWRYLLVEPAESVQKLEDSWLAYYFLTGNMAIGLVLATALGFFGAIYISIIWKAAIVFTACVHALNFCTLRVEIRELMRVEIRELIGYSLPHEGVYTRIKCSTATPSGLYKNEPNTGVGVVAIRDIPKGMLVFAPDDDTVALVSSDKISALPTEIRKLYEDFAVLKNGSYICPTNFNKLTVSWYLNCSEDPNVEADKALRFRALHDIRAGDELFSRYSDYSQ